MDNSKYDHGLTLFNAGQFYEAHEILEDVWREASGEDKVFLQSLIQIAVALYHHSRGNAVGARSLLAKARKRLGTCPDPCAGVIVANLCHDVDLWQEALSRGSALPPFPHARRTGS